MYGLRRILVGVDWRTRGPEERFGLSEPAFEAAKRAVELAASSDAEVTFTSILDCVDESSEQWNERAVDERVRPELDRRLLALAEWAEKQGAAVRASVCYGTAWVELVREVLREQYDLVVLGARAATPDRPLGNVALKVIRNCPCHVWVPTAPASPPDLFVLAATDLSDDGLDVLHLAVQLGQVTDSKTRVLHVVERAGEAEGGQADVERSGEAQTERPDEPAEDGAGGAAASVEATTAAAAGAAANTAATSRTAPAGSHRTGSSEQADGGGRGSAGEPVDSSDGPAAGASTGGLDPTAAPGSPPAGFVGTSAFTPAGPVADEEEIRPSDPVLAAAADALHEQLACTDYRTLTFGVLPHVRYGQADQTILRAIDEFQIDLLVVGSGGSAEVPGQLGSTAEVLLPRAPCGVLVVKPRDFQTPVTA